MDKLEPKKESSIVAAIIDNFTNYFIGVSGHYGRYVAYDQYLFVRIEQEKMKKDQEREYSES